MRVLVTGSEGYVGRVLVSQLRLNSIEVVTTDMVGHPDLRGDLRDANFASSLPDVDGVIHLAAVQYFSPLPLFRAMRYLSASNVDMAVSLRKRYDPSVFVLAVGSSMQLRSSPKDGARLDELFANLGPYSQSKNKAFELLSEHFTRLVWVCPPVVLDSQRGGIVRLLVLLAKHLRLSLRVIGGANKISVISRSDLVAAIVSLVDKSSSVYAFSSIPDLSYSSIASAAANGKRVIEVPVPIWVIRFVARATLFRVVAREQLQLLSENRLVPSLHSVLGLSSTDRARLLSEFTEF